MNPEQRTGESDLRGLTRLMDVDSALKRLGDDRELFDQIIQIYIEDAPELLLAARRALADSDASALRRAAHSLKGLTATLSAQSAVSAAFQLEQIGASGDLGSAREPLDQLTRRVSELNELLQKYHDSVAPQSPTP